MPVEGALGSAHFIIKAALQQYGLGDLADWAWNLIKQGVTMEQIMLDLRERPEYQTRFPAMETLAQKGRAISEAEYIAYESQAVAMMRAAGIPEGFYDQPDDFAAFLTNEVSVAELESRIQLAQNAAMGAPVELRAELERLYGMGPGDLTAFWIDPDKALPLLTSRFTSASIGAESRRAGYGLLTADEAERLAGLGIEPGQAGQGFGELAGLTETFGALTRGEEEIGRETQLGVLKGSQPAIEAISRKQRRRVSEFEESGGYAANEGGFSGVGSARR